MYCPQCLTEYRVGFIECSDCRVPLALGNPPKLSAVHELEWVTVLETHDTFALSLAKAALEEAGIEYVVDSRELRNVRMPQDGTSLGLTPMCGCDSQIRVARECEEEARELLEPLRNPEPGGLDVGSEPES